MKTEEEKEAFDKGYNLGNSHGQEKGREIGRSEGIRFVLAVLTLVGLLGMMLFKLLS